jgi:hypothetical protein
MGEGVDPTEMCQSLLGKVNRYRELAAVADPEILVLFEEWLEALEEEMVAMAQEDGSLNTKTFSQKLGLSQAGAEFLLARLRREGKLPKPPGC